VLRTIADLENVTQERVAEACASVRLKDAVLRQMRKDSRRIGITREQYLAALETLEPVECPTCGGSGQVTPQIRSVGVVHPSSAHCCRARLYYDLVAEHEVEQELDPALVITFEIGHAIHRICQRALRAAFPNFESEVRVDLPEAFVQGGSADGVLDTGDLRVLIELKTIGDSSFKDLRKPKEDHTVQTAIYATALDTPIIAYLYISKGPSHPMKEFVVPYDGAIYRKWLLEKVAPIDEALSAGKPPVADAKKYECEECAHGTHCPQNLAKIRDPFRRS